MKFKVDENLPAEASELLREAGFQADSVLDEGFGGTEDPDLAIVFQCESRALITLDRGFADMRTYPPRNYAGIIVIRSKRQDKSTLLSLVKRFTPMLTTEPLDGCLWIVEADRVRIAKIGPTIRRRRMIRE